MATFEQLEQKVTRLERDFNSRRFGNTQTFNDPIIARNRMRFPVFQNGNLPTTCEVGEIAIELDAAGTTGTYKQCATSHTWTGLEGSAGAKTATFIVGPSSNSDSATYDYETDGTDDDVQIQAAIDALPTNGGTVVLREGTYTLGVSVTSTNNGIRLLGMGAGTIITPKASFGTDGALVSLTGANVQVQNIKFDGLGRSAASGKINGLIVGDNCVVSDCQFVNLEGDVLGGPNGVGDDGVVENCYFSNWGTFGPGADYAIAGSNERLSVIGCVFEGTDADDLFISDVAKIDSCVFVMAASFAGTCIADAQVVINSEFYAPSISGGTIIFGDTYSAVIANNLIILNGVDTSAGTVINSGVNGIVVGNTISGGGFGIILRDRAVCKGNVIDGLGYHGITTASHCTVVGNMINNVGQETNDTYQAIRIPGGSTYCTIVGNIVTSTATNKHQYGIREVSSTTSGPTVIGDNILRNAVTANLSTQNASTVSANNITA